MSLSESEITALLALLEAQDTVLASIVERFRQVFHTDVHFRVSCGLVRVCV